ncbi:MULTISPECIES: hypothetical protein [unclassified Bradyrhizobium]|uniref:hypothetical protein n=1 Tax=unclassified Bradyrhizobium TaxID=2631580 RepID=UPI00247902DB|nr:MULTISPECIES: hypothetical protein [unclassified Bradyrhizobium]WGR91418.1 hypothetical protein MTX20_23450 [Bradyrhizobium sp. ISRA435]WGS01667.1 hypothetical protein MTX23_12975 [Bradyrhizobium sp. ISRA436]WGS08553.1 hypothetical protein MTX18_12965 [Bradyrhizobium sp. ISRA437]WGS15441.1 hypothetical protein MTX26_12965 [Bradyrhizobium sp. ISRA443]WGS23092.1 hypothetical protein MTX22_16505 [Bradyrhizobium sp. ISRA463]
MGQERISIAALLTGAMLTLSGCGLADSHAVWPEFLKAKASDPAPLETPPDIKQLVGTKLDSVFAAGSQPTHVRVSAPLHDPRGPGWTACVRAELTSVIGKPLGTQTYRIFIDGGTIQDRRLVDADDNCLTENYEPIESSGPMEAQRNPKS